MEDLDLRLNNFGENGAICLLPCLHKVQHINLCGCGITDEEKNKLKIQLSSLNFPVSLPDLSPYTVAYRG